MKKIFSVLLAATLLLCCILPASAVSASEGDSLRGEITFETVTLGGKAMTIPVLVQDRVYGAYSTGGSQMGEQEVTYYIPVTPDAQVYNENYVQSAMAASSSGTATDTFPDPHNYFQVTTYIPYTLYPSEDNTIKDYLISIDNVAITKGKEPPDIEWDILGIGTPEVRVVQAGVVESGGILDSMNQVMDYTTVQWGTRGINTPSNWVPVMTGSYSDYYRGLAMFRFDITYSTMGTVTCECNHVLAK